MNILCVIDSLGSGGAQRQLVNLAISFKSRGHHVTFMVYHPSTFYNEILLNHDIPIIEVLELNYLKRLLKMRKLIRNGQYDSVLSFLEAPSFICEVAGLPYRKWKLTVGERSANPQILKSHKLRFYRYFHFLADNIVANSHSNLRLIQKANPLLSKIKMHVIYNLIDFNQWQPRQNKYEFKKNNHFNLIIVASHQYLKNLDGLVEAVNLLSEQEKKDLVINWYGSERLDKSKSQALEKIERYQLNNIFNFHKPTINIAEKVNEADALGLFSFYEGLPNVVCEAMVNAKPVISSSVSDIPLLIDSNLIFDPKDIEDIREKLSFLLTQNETSLIKIGKRNRMRALNAFNKDSITNTYLELMKKHVKI